MSSKMRNEHMWSLYRSLSQLMAQIKGHDEKSWVKR